MKLKIHDHFRGIARVALLTLLACFTLPAQYKPSSTCKFLTPDEAVAVIGPGAKLISAIQDGACTYSRGPLTLTVAQPARIADRNVLQLAFESSGRGEKTRPVAGVGDRAHIKKQNSGYQLMFLKGNVMGGVEVYGEGSDGAPMGDKLIAAAKKVTGRL